jgi:hypothetical protein
MAKIGEIISAGGVLPALASGAMGKENRGFAAGLIPGMLYKEHYRDEQEEERQRMAEAAAAEKAEKGMKKGGKVKKMAAGGYKKAADGCAQRGKTKGRMI